MMKLIVLAMLVASAVALEPLSEVEHQTDFARWTEQHGKTYKSHFELFQRFNIYKKNAEYIRTHNANKDATFTLAMNEFGDLTNEEFRTMYNRFTPSNRVRNFANLTGVQVPSSVDWRSKGAVTPVKNQGQCGSCWSFSTTGSIEGAYYLSKGQLISLSEQQLVDCSGSYGNMGCNGGLVDQAFRYVIHHGGLCHEEDYTYEAVDDTCRSSSCTPVVTISSYHDVGASKSELTAAIAQQPVSVAVDAAGENWQFYSGGVMSSYCSTNLDHAVLAVGYADGYWLVKNSWGTGWGESGYIKLDRTTSQYGGQCGIELSATYPIV